MAFVSGMAAVFRVALVSLLFMSWLPRTAFAQDCIAPWPGRSPVFLAGIDYGDWSRKADPYITVRINRKPAKMLLDTGSNAHVVWDARLFEGESDRTGREVQTLDAIASSTTARAVSLPLEDSAGRGSVQTFYVIAETPLLTDGFSGIISPQYLAQDKASIINFSSNCFFVGDRFDPSEGGRYRTQVVGGVPNHHRVMAIPLDIPGGRVPVVVDSGAYRTTLLASLIRNAPLGPHQNGDVDLLGNVVTSERRTRLVSVVVNGLSVLQHPVVPVSSISERGVVSLGAIGMDLLRERVIFYDGDRNRFAFVEVDAQAGAAR